MTASTVQIHRLEKIAASMVLAIALGTLAFGYTLKAYNLAGIKADSEPKALWWSIASVMGAIGMALGLYIAKLATDPHESNNTDPKPKPITAITWSDSQRKNSTPAVVILGGEEGGSADLSTPLLGKESG